MEPGASASARSAPGSCSSAAAGPTAPATLFGLAIAATIAGYTLIDNTGVTLADPLAYLEAVMVGPALVTAAVVAVRQGRPALRAGFRRETVLIAPLTLAPYALTLYALRLAPAAPVAAVRETSVLFVTVARGRDAQGARLAVARGGRRRRRRRRRPARRLDN